MAARSLFLIAAALLAGAPMLLQAERWKVQFFHDEDQSSLTLTDIAFPTAKTGIACGTLVKIKDEKAQGVVLVTRDGGKNWNRVEVGDHPVALHFVDESTGYMLTNRGIWKTDERGLTWKKQKGVSGMRSLHFLDAKRGFVVGFEKQMLATEDGGVTWKPVEDAKKPSSNPAITNYGWIAFNGPERGIVLGNARPRRKSTLEVPAWADPEAAASEREWPSLSVTLETRDGGKTWEPQTAPIFGNIVRLRFVPQGLYGISIVRFEKAFSVPTEVYLFNWKTGKSESIYKEKGHTVTDAAFLTPTSALIALIERPGTMAQSPVPGKLKILRASNLRSFIDIPVDYRASGTRAILSVVDENNAWVALDSGMILHLEP